MRKINPHEISNFRTDEVRENLSARKIVRIRYDSINGFTLLFFDTKFEDYCGINFRASATKLQIIFGKLRAEALRENLSSQK